LKWRSWEVVFLLLRVCAIFPYFATEFGGSCTWNKLVEAPMAYALPFSLSVVVQ